MTVRALVTLLIAGLSTTLVAQNYEGHKNLYTLDVLCADEPGATECESDYEFGQRNTP